MQQFGSFVYSRRPLAYAGALLASAVVTVLSSVTARAAAPPNDNFANPSVLTGDFGTVTVDTTSATVEAGEPSHAGVAPRATVWYSWTASTDAQVEFDTYGSGINTVLAVYTGSVLGNLDLIAANDDINNESFQDLGAVAVTWMGPSGVKFNAKRGTKYYVAVGSSGVAGGAVTLNWAYTSSGVFRFSADTYTCAESDMWDSIISDTAWSPLGARITISRQFGTVGKCIVSFTCTDGATPLPRGTMPAVAGRHYLRPARTDVVFDDFEISKTILIRPIDDGVISAGNPGRMGMCDSNRVFTISLAGVRLDPGEDPTVVSPPRIDPDHSNSVVTIVDMDGAPDSTGTNGFGCEYTNGVASFERFQYRTSETIGTVMVPVYPVNRDTSKSQETHYVIDSTSAPGSNTRLNTFPLAAGSDYAAPDFADGRLSLNVDFDLPYAPGDSGILTWGTGDASPKYIPIVIHADGLPEFNEDIRIRLFVYPGHSLDTDLLPGNIGQCTVTILHNDYPAGALDDLHNREYDITTDPPLNTNPGTDGTVYSVLVQPDDKTIVAGNFGAYNAVPRYGIARINFDGSLDHSFDPGDGVPVKAPINPGFISCMTFTPGNKVVLGGNFPSYNGTSRNNIARINADGSLDNTFNPGLGANDIVWAVASQTNGQVIIAGQFTKVNGYPRSSIARLNPDGTLDPTFDPGLNGINGTVYALALTADGSMYIGGDFTTNGGLYRRSVSLLNSNGVPVTTFNPVVGVDGPVLTMAVQSNGKLLIGGSFANAELRSRRNIARYNADGTLDLSFDPGTGTDDSVFCIKLQPDGRPVLTGVFNSYNQTRRMCLARLLTTGELDTSFMDTAYNQFAGPHKPYYNPYTNPKDFLLTAAFQSDGNLMIGGSFHYLGGGRVTLNVQTNWTPPVDYIYTWSGMPGYDRNAYRLRNNVARILGGDTLGPGSIGLIATNYSVVENMGYLFVKLSRQNGYLGQVEANFSVPGRTDGPGVAKSGVDYLYQPSSPRRGNPFFDSAWGNVVRALSDGMFGTNNVAMDIFGHNWVDSLEDVYITVLNRSAFQGDRSMPFKIDCPSLADVFYLGGDNIPLGTALARTSSSMVVQEDDVRPGVIGFSTAGYSVNENGTNATITITRTNGSTGLVSVRFATTNGTAVAGTDYVGYTNSVTFGDGQTSKTVTVQIINDSIIQSADKTVNLYLAAPGNGATLGTLSNAVLSIIDDDFLPGKINFTATTYTTNEEAPAVIIPVTRTGGNLGVLDIQYATTNLSAISNVNYVTTSGSLHWDDGDTTVRYISVPLRHDNLVTANKQFTIGLFNPSVPNSAGSRVTATVTLVNTDFYGTLQFSRSQYNVSEQGGYATITVVRTGGNAETVSASFRTLDGTAPAFFSYLPTNGSLVFGPGEVSRSFTVPILDDQVQDPASWGFNVQLSSFSPASAVGSPTNTFVNIVDAQRLTVPPGQVDTFFNPNAGFNNDVFAITLQPDGKMLAGGDFTLANGLPVNRLTRLTTDGIVDQGFLTPTLGGANAAVRAIVNQTDTRILVGGSFTTMDNLVRNYLARLNYDGSVDTGFTPGSAADAPVYALAETFDLTGPRKVMVGGAFNTFNGVLRPGVVRLNDDGTVDNAFNAGIGVNGTVYAIAVYPTNTMLAGKVVIGGEFTAVDGVARIRIARLNVDGTLDRTFDPGTGFDSTVRALVLQPDGNVIVGGGFTNVNGVAMNRIARLRRDGSVDPAFQPGVGANDQVYALALQDDNRIVVGGGFTRASGTTRNRLTRLMPNGQVDPTINFGTGANDFVASVAIQTDGKLLMVGGFTEVQGLQRVRIARLYGGSMVGSGSFRFTQAAYEVDELATNVLVTVLREGGTSGANQDGSGNISVNVATSDGTAIDGVNYAGVNMPLVFPPGETMQTFVIPVLPDQQITADLVANLALSNPTFPAVLGPQPTAILRIFNDDAAISFASSTFIRAEDALDGAATIELVRTGSTRMSSSVLFSTTTNGTAIPGLNYTPITNAVVTFAPGQTAQSIKVPVLHYPLADGDKTVGLELSSSLAALLLTPYQATLTIQDVDSAPGQFRFSQTNYFVGEGDGYALVTVVRTNGRAGDVSVTALTLPGDATPGLKYVPTNYALPFASGETVKSFRVPILEEGQVEGNQTLFLLLTNAIGGTTIGGLNPVPLTIIDDDVGVSFSTNSAQNAVYITSETNTQVVIDVYRLNAPTNLVTTVSYFTTNGTAMAGTNYVPISGALTFNRGEFHKTISVSLLRDPRVTGDLTFAVALANPSPGVQIASPVTANVVINDIDSGLRIASSNPTNAEFSVVENGTNVVITVLRSNPNTGLVRVNYATSDGTATAPWDYLSASGVLVFTNGQLSNSFSIPIIDNSLVDGDRSFTVSLFSPSVPAQLLQPSSATINILDNEAGFHFSNPTYEIAENGVAAVIPVHRIGFTNNTVAVSFATRNGTARPGVDYAPTNGILTFTNGEVTKRFTVNVIDNTMIDGDRTVLLNLSNPTGSSTLVTPSAATLTIHDNDGSLIIPAGSALVSESFSPADKVIQPGEAVSMLFGFRNSAGTNTVDLMATLLATNGVASPSGAQSYGSLVAEGPSASRLFSFTANGTNGQRIFATFQLTDSGHPVSTNAGLVVFTFTLGTSTASATNSALVRINDDAPATPYPSILNVSGVDGVVGKVTLTLNNYNHTAPQDVDVLLVSPDGQSSLAMANAGAPPAVRANLSFDDDAAAMMPQAGAVVSGTNKPSVYYPVGSFPVPAPPVPSAGRYTNSFRAFNGTNPNGAWQLFVVDDSALDSGAISNGWRLNFTLVNPVVGSSDVGLAMAGTPPTVVIGSNVTYTLSAVNYGPGAATGVTVNDILPAGSVFVSANASSGTVATNGAGLATWTVGSMAKDASATMTLIVRPTFVGTITNVAAVSTGTPDLNPDDDLVEVVSTVIVQTADLAIGVSGTPNPLVLGQNGPNLTYFITVSNLGPGSATAVAVEEWLPNEVAFVSASPETYRLNGSTLTFTNLGALDGGQQMTLTIVVRPTVGSTLTNTVICSSPILDPRKVNNSATIKTEVNLLQVSFVQVGNNLFLGWPEAAQGYTVQSATNLSSPIWEPVTNNVVITGGQHVIALPIGPGNQFFRLVGPGQ